MVQFPNLVKAVIMSSEEYDKVSKIFIHAGIEVKEL